MKDQRLFPGDPDAPTERLEALADEFQELGAVGASSGMRQALFFALQSQAHIYGGTVDPAVVAARRGRNRAARASRRGDFAAIRRQARANRRQQQRFARGQAPDPLGLRGEEVGGE